MLGRGVSCVCLGLQAPTDKTQRGYLLMSKWRMWIMNIRLIKL